VKRTAYGPDHLALQELASDFFTREAVPHIREWTASGRVDRSLFAKAGELGLLGLQAPEEWGGGGGPGFSYNAVVSEASVSAGFVNVGIRLHSDIVLPYFLGLATAEQSKRWLPALVNGRLISAIAMSEPGTGSDLSGIRTTARREGNGYVLNGSKAFITNGWNADLIVVVARTSSDERDQRRGLTALVAERGMEGFTRGQPYDKIGLRYSDTTDLFFSDVWVPEENRLGAEDQAFKYLTANLPQERVSISVGAVAMARAAVSAATAYAKDRTVFGKRLASFQNTRFVLAEADTETEACEHLLDRALLSLESGELTPADAARLKLFCTERQSQIVDRCLQVFGGYGYLREYPIADMFTDSRVTRIYGGSTEVMKMIIAKAMGL
jgi:acyl-CoA dehydrogenase